MRTYSIIADDLALGSPGQQLLDRFLFAAQCGGAQVIAWSQDEALLRKRQEDFRFTIAKSIDEALRNSQACLAVLPRAGDLQQIFAGEPNNPLFVYGSVSIPSDRKNVAAGTVFSTLLQLPPMQIPERARVRETLMIGDVAALDSLIATLDREPLSIQDVRTLEGEAVWRGRDREWAARLLAAAVSRSDKIQGNTLLDGRTEDIVALGLIEKMTKAPRALVIEFTNNSRATLMTLEGAIGDLVIAVETGSTAFRRGRIYSTQLFQSPSPQQEQYSRLVSVIDEFFCTRKAPWTLRRTRLKEEMLAKIGK